MQALDGVNFDLAHGDIHVLFGENGAGKSTLINVIAGTYPPDGGRLVCDGQELRHLSPHHARLIGISPVFQEFSLVPDLTVAQIFRWDARSRASDFCASPRCVGVRNACSPS